MHGLTGGRWRSSSYGESERCTHRETGGTEPGRLPLADQPAAYPTGSTPRGYSNVCSRRRRAAGFGTSFLGSASNLNNASHERIAEALRWSVRLAPVAAGLRLRFV